MARLADYFVVVGYDLDKRGESSFPSPGQARARAMASTVHPCKQEEAEGEKDQQTEGGRKREAGRRGQPCPDRDTASPASQPG